MSTGIDRFDEGARRRVEAHGRTVVHEDELVRHPVYTRVVHWSAACASAGRKVCGPSNSS